jgi:hypothetical protein
MWFGPVELTRSGLNALVYFLMFRVGVEVHSVLLVGLVVFLVGPVWGRPVPAPIANATSLIGRLPC